VYSTLQCEIDRWETGIPAKTTVGHGTERQKIWTFHQSRTGGNPNDISVTVTCITNIQLKELLFTEQTLTACDQSANHYHTLTTTDIYDTQTPVTYERKVKTAR